MRAAGKLAAEVLNYAGTLVRPGVTTDEIDVAVHAMIVAAGAYPSPLNYGGFPKSVCTSLNECICHGIPDSTVLQDGDIINIDVTVFLDGHHGDTSRTFLVGAVDAGAAALVEATTAALAAAIAVCKPGVPFKQIGATIHALADQGGYGVVPAFVGHGVGRMFHSGPTIVHCRNNEPGVMAVGQTFTIEPMLTLGSPKERFWPDEWTAVTADGSWSAQCEHTLLIVPGGVEVLTMAEGTPAVAGLPSAAAMAAAAAAEPARKAPAPKSKGFGRK
jgi:methionyl aminopeptidase